MYSIEVLNLFLFSLMYVLIFGIKISTLSDFLVGGGGDRAL